METRGQPQTLPAFNQRPPVEAAAGLILGIALARYLTGTLALIAVCLFALIGALGVSFRVRRVTVVAFACAIGCLRMYPVLLSCNGALDAATLRSLADVRYASIPFLETLAERASALSDAVFLEASPLVRAILLGDKASLSYFTQSAFREAGAAHLLALSGLHVGILASIVITPVPKRRPGLRLGVAAAFLSAYCALANFPASLVRAGIMTLLMLTADACMRKNDPLNSLSLACIVILTAFPMRLYNAGFILSFSATAGILMLYTPVCDALKRIPSSIVKPVALTASATASSLPFTLLLFGTLPLYSLFSNLLLVPLVTFALPIALFSLMLGVVWLPAGVAVGCTVRLLLGASEGIAVFFASLPFSTLKIQSLPYLPCLLYLAALVLLSKYCLLPKRTRCIASCALIFAAAALLVVL